MKLGGRYPSPPHARKGRDRKDEHHDEMEGEVHLHHLHHRRREGRLEVKAQHRELAPRLADALVVTRAHSRDRPLNSVGPADHGPPLVVLARLALLALGHPFVVLPADQTAVLPDDYTPIDVAVPGALRADASLLADEADVRLPRLVLPPAELPLARGAGGAALVRDAPAQGAPPTHDADLQGAEREAQHDVHGDTDADGGSPAPKLSLPPVALAAELAALMPLAAKRCRLAAWRHGGKAWRHGGKARRHGGMAARRRSVAAWRQSWRHQCLRRQGVAAWRHGGKDASWRQRQLCPHPKVPIHAKSAAALASAAAPCPITSATGPHIGTAAATARSMAGRVPHHTSAGQTRTTKATSITPSACSSTDLPRPPHPPGPAPSATFSAHAPPSRYLRTSSSLAFHSTHTRRSSCGIAPAKGSDVRKRPISFSASSTLRETQTSPHRLKKRRKCALG
eukprot:gene11686-biopygen415